MDTDNNQIFKLNLEGEILEEVEEFLGDEDIEAPTLEEPSEIEEEVEESEEESSEDDSEETAEVEEPVDETEESSEVEESDEAEETEELSELEKLKAQNVQLMEMLNQVAGGKVTPDQPKAQSKGESEGQPKEPEGESPKSSEEEVDWSKMFDGVNFDEVLDSEEGFKNFMTSVVQVLYQQQHKQFEAVPQLINHYAEQQKASKELHDTFYETYPELAGVKNYVGQVANGITAQNPTMEVSEVLTKTAETVKSALGITSVDGEKVKIDSKSKPKPNLPGSKGTRKPQQKKSAQQSEIDEILEF